MKNKQEIDQVQSEYIWSRKTNYTPEQKLAIYLIKDSIENIVYNTEYKQDSFLFLVDHKGELSFWLKAFSEAEAKAVVKGIYNFLERQPGLGM